MSTEIKLLDVVALTANVPEYHLSRGQIGAVVECYPDDKFEVEFVALDGYTYALAKLRGDQLIALREKPVHSTAAVVPARL